MNLKNILLALAVIVFLGSSIFAGYTILKNGTPGTNSAKDVLEVIKSAPYNNGQNDFVPKLTNEQRANCNTITPQVTNTEYYIANTPEAIDDNLITAGIEGGEMYFEGTVYGGSDNLTPIPNAKIEIWQADAKGNYRPQSNGDYSTVSKDNVALRGYITTDEKGEFSYASILPGEYEGRTRHVNYRISKDGYKTVSTSLTFYKEGDKFVAEKDINASQLLDCQNIKNIKEVDSVYNSTFDFRLQKL